MELPFLVSYKKKKLTFYALPSLKISTVKVKIPKGYCLNCITPEKLYFFPRGNDIEGFTNIDSVLRDTGTCYIYDVKSKQLDKTKSHTAFHSQIPQVVKNRQKFFSM